MIRAALVFIAALLGLQQINKDEEYQSGTTKLYDEYDYIIVGGGTTGLIVANRLTDDPNATVLVIEAGGSDHGSAFVESPWLLFFSLSGGAKTWNYKSTPQEMSKVLNGQRVSLPTGKILGGTSSTNGALYLRHSKHDMDSWEDHGATGWGWDETVKYFQRIENATDPTMSQSLGRDGNVRLRWNYQSKLTDWATSAAATLGIDRVDKTVLGSREGIMAYESNEYGGHRQSSSVAYFWPIWHKMRKRLHLALHSMVDKVIIETDQITGQNVATGVQFTKRDLTRTIRARKEVILSCGTYGTPGILMRSGIGPREHLEALNISVIADSPGVGSNLQNHPAFTQHWYSDLIPDDVVFTMDEIFDDFAGYQKHGETPLRSAGPIVSHLHIRTKLAGTNASLSTNARPFPELAFLFSSLSVVSTDIYPLTNNYKVTDWKDEIRDAREHRNNVVSSFFIKLNLLHPKSTGTVRLQSSDPLDDPIIDTRYLTNPDDKKIILEGFRFLETFIQQKPFSDYNLTLVAQPYCNKEENNKLPRSDEFYYCLMESTTTAEHHPSGTAKIGSDNDPMAVLDERL